MLSIGESIFWFGREDTKGTGSGWRFAVEREKTGKGLESSVSFEFPREAVANVGWAP
jgi:hypothetical protein